MPTYLVPPGPPPLSTRDSLGPRPKINFPGLMTDLGYGNNPTDNSTNTTTPQGIGNVVAAAVLNFRHHDGSNQLGDEPKGGPVTRQPRHHEKRTPTTPATRL